MEWFLRQGARVEGPLAEADLCELIAAGRVATDALVAPSGPDLGPLSFRPLNEWHMLSTGCGEAPRTSERKGTALLGTEAPFLSDHQTHITARGTAVLGTDGAIPPQAHEEPRWPGAPQDDPLQPKAGPEANAFGDSDSDQTFFDAVAADSPFALDNSAAPFAPLPDSKPSLQNEPERTVVRAPLARVDVASLSPAPAPRLLPVKAPTKGPLIAVAITLALGLGSFGAWAADRVMNGPPSSNISRYLPAGAPYYLEVPSMKRWATGLGRVVFLRSHDRVAAELFESLSDELSPEADTKMRMRRFASIESFAITQVEGHTLSAVRYETDEALAEYLRASPEKAEETEWGKRYETAGGFSCLWLEDDRVELCGKEGALDAAIDVLAGRAPSAEEDPYLNAAKKRPFWSYLPFAETPAFYAVGNPTLFSKSPASDQLSLATSTGGLDRNGYHEKVDLVFRPGKAPHHLGTGTPLTLWRDLREGTLFYANFHLQLEMDDQGMEEEGSSARALARAAPSFENILKQAKDALGFHPAELTQGLASEALVALTFPPEERLTKDAANNLTGALWIHLTIADHTKVRRTLNALVERLSGEQSTLFWKDDSNLVGTLPSGLGAHLLLEKNLLRLGIGRVDELSRVFGSSKRLSDDFAHEAAVADLDHEVTALAWLDAGRLLAEPSFAAALEKSVAEDLASLDQSFTLTGPTRPTSAVFLRQFASGDMRIRSRNFPTGLLLFALGTLGQDSADLPLDTAPNAGRPSNENETPRIGPSADGTFPLPPPPSEPPSSDQPPPHRAP